MRSHAKLGLEAKSDFEARQDHVGCRRVLLNCLRRSRCGVVSAGLENSSLALTSATELHGCACHDQCPRIASVASMRMKALESVMWSVWPKRILVLVGGNPTQMDLVLVWVSIRQRLSLRFSLLKLNNVCPRARVIVDTMLI